MLTAASSKRRPLQSLLVRGRQRARNLDGTFDSFALSLREAA
jgi:hypothetical protein